MEKEILTNEHFIEIIEESAIEALAFYNLTYGTNHELDLEIYDYLLAFSIVSVLGVTALRGRQDISQDIKRLVLKQFPKDYRGIKATTREQLENLTKRLGREPLAKELEEFRKRRIEEITDGAYYSTRNELERILAEQDGLNIVACSTVGDSRVRPEHKKNDQKFWRASTYAPWNDYNCRCDYVYFRNRQEARQAGFSPL